MTRGFRGAVAFLTRIPADRGHAAPEVARSVPWFPVVGALVGAVVAGVHALGLVVWAPLPASVAAVAAGVVLTGALHEDGLADVADALGARSPEEARRIMRDPAHGTYGVAALGLSLLARVGAVASLGPWGALAWIPAAHAASRGAAVGLLAGARDGGDGGLGGSTASHLAPGAARLALLVGLALAAAAVGPWAAAVAALVLGASLGVGRLAARRLGGVSGDAVGAAQQVGELLVLLLGAAAVGQGWPGAVWWR